MFTADKEESKTKKTKCRESFMRKWREGSSLISFTWALK